MAPNFADVPRRRLTFRTRHLLVIAGPPCSGKSTLLSRIHDGLLPGLCEQVSFVDPPAWTFAAATDLHNIHEPLLDRLVVHYDLLAQRTPGGFRHLPELFDRAERVVILTLWTEWQSLRSRNLERLAEGIAGLFQHPSQLRQRVRRLRRIWRRHRVFRTEVGVLRLYRDWFALASRQNAVPHWLFDSSTHEATLAEPFDRARVAPAVAPQRVSRVPGFPV